MPIDSAIPLQVQQFKVPGPQEIMSLQQLSKSLQMQDEQLREYRRKRESENALRTLFSEPDAIDPTTKLPTTGTLQKVMAIDPAAGVKLRGDMITAEEKRAQTDKAIAQGRAALANIDEKDRKIMGQIQIGAHNVYEQKLAELKDPALATKAAQEFMSSRLDEEDKLGMLNKRFIQQAQPFNAERSSIIVQALRSLPAEKVTAPTELKKLMDEMAALPEGDPRRKVYQDKITKLNAPTQTQVNLATNNNVSDDTLKFIAKQYLAGDRTVVQGFARSKDMMGKIREAITAEAKEQGMSPAATAQRVAEFEGQKAGQRALGTRSANIELAVNEASQFADLALEASGKFDRTNIKTLNDVQKAIQGRTASPELRQFEAANTSFINAYARAVNPNGVPTVSDKEHARQMLDTGFAKGDYKAAISQLQKEMSAAQKSPGVVKENMRELATGESPQRRESDKAQVLRFDAQGNPL